MLFGAEFWERFAYHGMRALLAVYVATAFFSALPAGEARAQASLTYGACTALIYGTGIFGGFIADRYLGCRPSILLGGALMAAGLGMIAGLVFFHWLTGRLGHMGAATVPGESAARVLKVLLGCLALVPVVFLMLSQATIVGYLLLLLFLAKILFWGMFEQAGSSLNFFARDHVDSPFDFTLFQSANPVFIPLMAPLFAWLWPGLDARGLNPSIPRKFAIALMLVALGFTTLVISIHTLQDDAGKVAWTLLALAYLINSMGELCLSPIGLSMVTKLAAPKDTGMAMGAWFMCTAIGNYAAGAIAAVAAGGSAGSGIAQYAATYSQINRLMHGVR